MISVSNDVYESHQQDSRIVYTRISLLNKNNLKVGEITGEVVDGSYSFNSESTVRRTCDLTILLSDNTLIPKQGSKIWLGSRCKVEIGILNILTNEINYNNLGIYIIDAPVLTHGLTTKELQLTLLDGCCLLDGTRGGYLRANTEIASGINIATAIKTTVQDLGEISDVNIEDINYTTPMKITQEIGSNVYDLLKTLKDLYMGYEMFFDENFVFVFQKIKDKTTDVVSYNFKEDKDVHIDYSLELDWQNVSNDITIFGKLLDSGIQYKANVTNTDANSPFNIDDNGHIYYSESNDNLMTQAQVDAYAQYMLFKRSNFNDKITINCLPIYYLRENQVIYAYDEEIGINKKYLIDSISCDLKFDGKMTITGHKLTYDEV